MTSTPGWARSHCARVSASRSGNRATGCRRSRSISTVPYVWRLRNAKSSTPKTRGLLPQGSTRRRTIRRSVWRLIIRPKHRLRQAPAAPPSARPMAINHAASRCVCRAHGATTPRQPFREDATGTLRVGTDELADAELPSDTSGAPGSIGECARVAAVDTMRAHSAAWTRHERLCRGHVQSHQCGRVVKVPRIELKCVVSGKKREKTVIASLYKEESNDVYTYTSLYT